MGDKVISSIIQFVLIFILIAINSVRCVTLEQDLILNLREKHALDKFRERVGPLLYQDYMKTDIYLIRWLRARSFNVDEAERMLKENIRWRRENRIDTIEQEEDWEDMRREFPANLDTQDREGRPVGEHESFTWDIRNAAMTGRAARLLRYMSMLTNNLTMQVFERQRRGMNVTQFVVLANTEGFNMIKHGCPVCIPFWAQYLTLFQNHFPGMMHEFIMINAPSTVHTLLELTRPFLNRQTRDALHILGSNKNQWMKYLDLRIDRSERRPLYGGTKPPSHWS